jgi:phosphatidylinositol alpha-1,6-mannosyltransferase
MTILKGTVLVVTSVFPRWKGDSTPPFVQNACEMMVKAGWDVHALAPHYKGARFSEIINGVHVWRYPYGIPFSVQKLCYEGGVLVNLEVRPWTKLLLPILYLAQLLSLSYLCLRLKPDLLHSHSLLPQGLSVSWVSRLFGLPHLATSHGNDVFGLKSTGLMGRLKQSVIGQVDAVTVNSEATRYAVLALGGSAGQVRFIPAVANEAPVDDAMIEEIDAKYGDARRLLFVGRLIEEKGVQELLHAFARVRKDYPDLQLFIVGDGALKLRLEELAKALSVDDAVHFVGWRPREEITSWMAAADVLVVPSWREAQGLVVVEAMSVGTLVVAANVGGLPDLVRDGETGYLCEPKSADSLTACLIQSLSALGQDELIEAATALYQETYSRASIQQTTEALYTEVIEHRKGRQA